MGVEYSSGKTSTYESNILRNIFFPSIHISNKYANPFSVQEKTCKRRRGGGKKKEGELGECGSKSGDDVEKNKETKVLIPMYGFQNEFGLLYL